MSRNCPGSAWASRSRSCWRANRRKPVIGRVAFVEPLLNQSSRTVRVRVILANLAGQFKPGMYAQASLHVPILPDGGPAPGGLEGKYVCPMHPYEVADKPRNCRLCGMPLELVPARQQTHVCLARTTHRPTWRRRRCSPRFDFELARSSAEHRHAGRGGSHDRPRQLVYVGKQAGRVPPGGAQAGPRAGDFYPVLDGLAEGDRVVVRGNFLIDSQFQITGKFSLLNPPEDRERAASTCSRPRIGNRPGAKDLSGHRGKLGSMGKPYKMSSAAGQSSCAVKVGKRGQERSGQVLKKLDEVKE